MRMTLLVSGSEAFWVGRGVGLILIFVVDEIQVVVVGRLL